MFNIILEISLYSSILGAVILLIRGLFKGKISSKWQYYIWLVFILKLSVPITITSPLSLLRPIDKFENINIKENKLQNISSGIENENIRKEENNKELQNTKNDTKISTNLPENKTFLKEDSSTDYMYILRTSIPYIWFIVLVLLFLVRLMIYVDFKSQINNIVPTENEKLKNMLSFCKKEIKLKKDIPILVQNIINSPAIIGVFKPKILLPQNILKYNDEEIKQILFHELIHYKKYDTLVNGILTILSNIYWFNPILIYCFKKIREDMEIKTDDIVLENLGYSIKANYGETLLKIAKNGKNQNSRVNLLTISKNKKGLKERLIYIMNSGRISKKKKILGIIILVLIIIVGGGMLTNKKVSNDKSSNQKLKKKDVEYFNIEKLNETESIVIEKEVQDFEREILPEDKIIKNINNKKIVKSIVEKIGKSEKLSNKYDKNEIPRDKVYTIKFIMGNKEKKVEFIRNSMYEIGYIIQGEECYRVGYELSLYIADLYIYDKQETDIDRKVEKLFDKYNLDISYRINRESEKLPNNLLHKSGEFPTKLYWGYNNDLSKSIGYDFKKYLGKEISIELYRLENIIKEDEETVEEYEKRVEDIKKSNGSEELFVRGSMRGVILKYKGEIVGSYIDNQSEDLSLEKKNHEEVTKKPWNKWVVDYIDYKDPQEQRLSKLSPKEIIEEHYKGVDTGNTRLEYGTISREKSYMSIHLNSDFNYLKNNSFEDANPLGYEVIPAKLLEINNKRIEKKVISKVIHKESQKYNKVVYSVTIDIVQGKNVITPLDDGIVTWGYVSLTNESGDSGYRILEIGN